MVTAVFATILVSVQNKSGDISDLLSSNMSEIKAKSLSNEALMYSIRQLNEGDLSVSQTGVSQSYSNFDVLDGTIDSIKYVMVGSSDTLRVTSFVTANVNGKQTQYQSLAEIYYHDSNLFDNAITCSKELSVTGHSDIVGDIEENVDIDFNTIFGSTMAQMRAIADNDYVDPPNNVSPINGITYIEGDAHFTNHHWSGSGILIVDGDFHMTGGTFDGIIWVEGGRFMMSGNGLVNGSIFANSDPDEQTKVTGNCDIYYSQTIVQQLLSTYNITPDREIKILSWDN
ncbi:MAG: hypothetical protein PF570_02275 [Candidatus Cloacimonetes bacterium]|jgi:hypothetical protein|nr:hypothetical protein [Candidatus Cloacimonadota bacterium]